MLVRFIIPATLFMISSMAPLKAETLELATNPFNEEVQPAARISGNLITGVQRQGPSAEEITMAAIIPAAWAGETVCVRVVAVDGLYESVNEYLVADDWPGGQADFPYPTRYAEKLSWVAQNEIGIRLSRGVCDGPAEEATLARWNRGEKAPAAMLVNSFQADAVFAYVGDSTTPVRCEPITLDGRSAYDTRCPLDDVKATGATEVQLLRIVKGKTAPPTSIILWFPGD